MARSYARVMSSIWTDPEFVNLGHTAQWAYLMLLSQPKLSLAGALDYMPRRWAKLGDIDEAELDGALIALEQARFVVVDYDTDELVIRTFVKHDLTSGGPRYENGVRAAVNAIQSEKLRALVEEALSERGSGRGIESVEPPSEPPSEPSPNPLPENRCKNLEPRTVDSASSFEAFWVRYPRRNGERAGKAKARDLWAKLTPELRDAAAAGLDAYSRAKGEFPEDAERYIRHRRWEGLDDEPVIDTPAVHRPSFHVADDTSGDFVGGLDQLRSIRVGRAI